MQNKIVHLMILDKFNVPFMDFISEHFDVSAYRFIFIGKPEYKYGLTPEHNVIWIDKKYKAFELLKYMYTADKIIIHGLWAECLLQLLFIQPWLLKKCYWVMWGGDFYFPETQSWVKKQVIRKMGHLVTWLEGDYRLAKEWYKATGIYHKSLVFPTSTYPKFFPSKKLQYNKTRIMIGNSGSVTNNHLEILKRLQLYKNEEIEIFCPLSYGDQKYIDDVVNTAKVMFGKKFVPILELLSMDEYLDFLYTIDIAVFNHNRQEGVSNAIYLLGMGKKVYMNKQTVQYEFFNDLGVTVFNNDYIELSKLDKTVAVSNKEIILRYFSTENLIHGLTELFGFKERK